MNYISVLNENIIGCGQCKILNDDVENIEVNDILYNDYLKTPKKYIYSKGQIILNPNYEDEQAKQRKETFLKDFFKVPNAVNNQDLYYRKTPKGYGSAVESINTAFNIVATVENLPANSLIFYEEPDFTKEEQCTEEWLVEHQVKNDIMTKEEFNTFYAAFITAWNTQEHE